MGTMPMITRRILELVWRRKTWHLKKKIQQGRKDKITVGGLTLTVALPLFICLFAAATVQTASDPVVPLKDIWALKMPGTRPMSVTKLGDPPAYESPEGLLVDNIRQALTFDPKRRPLAEECFAVRGSGMDALRGAHAVLVEGQARITSFHRNEPISLVFFSYSFNHYVHLIGVEKQGLIVRLSYRLVPHRTKEMTAHIALVPVSHPGSGNIRVEVTPRLDSTALALDLHGWVEKIVCRPFVFNVQ